jgi:hypothetical protein
MLQQGTCQFQSSIRPNLRRVSAAIFAKRRSGSTVQPGCHQPVSVLPSEQCKSVLGWQQHLPESTMEELWYWICLHHLQCKSLKSQILSVDANRRHRSSHVSCCTTSSASERSACPDWRRSLLTLSIVPQRCSGGCLRIMRNRRLGARRL